MDRVERCDRCKWWEKRDFESGACHRNPPQVFYAVELGGEFSESGAAPDAGSWLEAAWPVCDPNDFCGEFTLSLRSDPMGRAGRPRPDDAPDSV